MSETPDMDVQTDRVNALSCSQCNATLDLTAYAPLASIHCPPPMHQNSASTYFDCVYQSWRCFFSGGKRLRFFHA